MRPDRSTTRVLSPICVPTRSSIYRFFNRVQSNTNRTIADHMHVDLKIFCIESGNDGVQDFRFEVRLTLSVGRIGVRFK